MNTEPFIRKSVNWIYKHFEKGSGAMILITSLTGMGLSTIAQTCAVIFNKKYTDKQKAFMIPQELTEGIINIGSMLLITKPTQRFVRKLVKTGKIATKKTLEYMNESGVMDKRGAKNFDIRIYIQEKLAKMNKSEEFINLSAAEKESAFSKHIDVLDSYNVYADSISAITTTAGSAFSIAVLAPLIRNSVAAKYQKINMNRLQKHYENYEAQKIYSSKNQLKI